MRNICANPSCVQLAPQHLKEAAVGGIACGEGEQVGRHLARVPPRRREDDRRLALGVLQNRVVCRPRHCLQGDVSLRPPRSLKLSDAAA